MAEVFFRGLALVAIASSFGCAFDEPADRARAALGRIYVVDSTGDDADADPTDGRCETAASTCTLRAALEQIEAMPTGGGVADEVHFAIPGAGVHTISPTTALVARAPTIIDGYTQPGASPATATTPATLRIELDGSGTPLDTSGLVLLDGSTVRGLCLNRFFMSTASGPPRVGMISVNGNGNVVEGNYVGVDPTGAHTFENGTYHATLSIGITIQGDDNLIGGSTPAARNVVAGNEFWQIGVRGTLRGVDSIQPTNNRIFGNYVGLDARGLSPIAVDTAFAPSGIHDFWGIGTQIGSSAPGTGNVVWGDLGIEANASDDLRVVGNLVGTDATGTTALPAGHNRVLSNAIHLGQTFRATVAENVVAGQVVGIEVEAAVETRIEDNFVGVDRSGTISLANRFEGIMLGAPLGDSRRSYIRGNTVAFNGADGIGLRSGSHIQMLSNRVFGNGGLGINIGVLFSGVDGNDPGDTDTGTNELQNFPVLESVVPIASGHRLELSLDSEPSEDYLVQVFANRDCDPSGYGEAEDLVAELSVRTDATGAGSATVDLPATIAPDAFLTATATDSEDNTSELSACLGLNQPPLAVCTAVTVSAGPMCDALASIDGGSSDPDGDPLTVSQDPPGPYSLGSTLVTLTVTDPAGESASCSAAVEVVDDTAPSLTCPADIEVAAEAPDGVTVTYTTTLGDNCPGATASCDTPSGGRFPIGSTSVSCAAIDGSGNVAGCGFSITVLGPEEQARRLRGDVIALGLPAGIETSLVAKIEAALAALAAGGTVAACNQLWALRNEVLAQRGVSIAPSDADALIRTIDRIRMAAGCP